jgi:RimJ/RimL family protein N-acetyltransferase
MEVRALTTADAEAIAIWRYPGRDSTYDVGVVVTVEQGFWAVEDLGQLVGYCCFGEEARVPGIGPEEGTLDVGYGMRPDLVGKGRGRSFVGAILAFAMNEFSPRRLRLLILTWNERSRKVAVALGFTEEGIVPSTEGEFRLMEADATRSIQVP